MSDEQKRPYEQVEYAHDPTCAKRVYMGFCSCGAGVNRCSTAFPEWACEARKGHPGDCSMTVQNPAS